MFIYPILRILWRFRNAAEKQKEYGFAWERRAGWKGTAGEKAINPAQQQGQTDAERESLNACESRDQKKQHEFKKKKKITSCQTNWVTFMTKLVTEQRWKSTSRGKGGGWGVPATQLKVAKAAGTPWPDGVVE